MRKISTGVILVCMLVGSSLLFAGGGPNVNGAKLYIKQDDLEKAIGVLLKEVEKVNAKNEDAWYLLGYVYARQGEYAKMAEAFDKAVELKPKFKDKGVKISKDSGTEFHS
ncbi:MAG: tetratricopeptide repeat protein, partial [Caldithrix sp.]